ncbi:DNA-dependent protein kinase catalytic subunit [Erpetoichthys calabaricus]|uniref:DNA-dependent protein kinase catalytic subunit n=1 Tax=Erpetoichthys calabaricus TaxID=27687 RepID=UPI002234270A|nr:DNA-dependent protein kinase catalytic subunit [Erpetoichthys calabaricus]
MASNAARGVYGCLQKLHALFDIGDSKRANEEARDHIRDLGHECMLSRSESDLVLQTSLLFSKENGLLLFLRKSLSIDDLRESRDEVLKLIMTFLERITNRIIGWEKTYGLDIKDVCLVVYTKDRAARSRVSALDLLIKLLYDSRGSTVLQDFKIADIFNKFYGDLVQKSKFADTVLEKVYELLGILAEVQPSDMLDSSDKLYRAYLSELKLQMTSATREPKLPVVAGCLKGLTALMINFTKSMEEDPKTSKEIFDYALKAITPQTELKRYAVLLAGLYLFSKHASQFSTCLLDNYQYLFEILSKYCSHSNVDMKKAGHAALDTFLKEVSLLVAENAELHKSKLEYFMRQFYSIIRTLDCSTKELSIAIRGYGLFAGPCKALRSNDSDDIDFMYTELIQRCKQMYLTESDTEDDNMYQLPSFLDSISSVILHLDKIPEVYTPVLERLLVVQIDSFPQYSQKMQPACCRSIIKVLVALAGKGPVLWSFISTVVHQGLIRVCSKPMLRSGEEESDQEKDAQVRSGKWKIPSYRDYLDLFKSLLDCDKMMESGFVDGEALSSPLRSLNRLLYDELMKSLLKIIEKLDLSVHTPNVEEEMVGNFSTENNLSIPSSDPSANLFPSKPKDFTAFINLVDFCSELLLQKHNDYFAQWVYVLGYELILQSTRFPLVSGFYKLLSVCMKIAKKIKYFQGVGPKTMKPVPDNQNVYACFALFVKFGKEVCSRMKQYKDELLASCLFFVLSLPPNIVTLDIRPYIPSLQTAFILGLSHPPLANAGLEALENWSEFIPKHDIQPYYNNVLPCLDGYLKATALSDEEQLNWQVSSLPQSSEKNYRTVLMRLLKKTKQLSMSDDSPAALVRRRVVRLLGHLGGKLNRSLITATCAEDMMKKFVAWETEKKLNFPMPFADMKPIIFLDVFLPHVAELALSTSDRQTKVAACELLHSILMYMLGKGSQMPEGPSTVPPLYRLHKHIFPVLLRLACDVDQVTRQLYEPLVMQLIHWFTSNKKFESQDTVAMLEAILDGLVHPVESTLRDFCGQCVQEFLKWSIKQTTPEQQKNSPANTKSLFKRLYSLALHPNAFKRLGAALAFNSIYKHFREEEALVDQFVFEVLVIYIESLALAHTDDKSLGTLQQCSDALKHLERIIKYKATSLNKASKRRIPRGFAPDKPVCLMDVVLWLLEQCGRPQTECRHRCMELFYGFVPLLPGNKNTSLWLDDLIKKQGVSFLIDCFECGGSVKSGSGILSKRTLQEIQEPFSLRITLRWMDMLLASLDCYNTFIGLRFVKPYEILGSDSKSGFLQAVRFFLSNLALHDVSAAEKCFESGAKGVLFSPREQEHYNFKKGTIIVRTMEFVTMVLENCQPQFWKVLENHILNLDFFKLTAVAVCIPSNIGFNMADVEVMKNLPDVCVRLMKALKNSVYKDKLEACIKEMITAYSVQELCEVDFYKTDSWSDQARLMLVLSACKQLHRAELLNSTLQSQASRFGSPLGSRLLSVVYKGIAPGGERKSLPSLDVSSRRLADGLLQLAFSLGDQTEPLVDLLLNTVTLSVPLSGHASKNFISFSHGEYFYNLFQDTINYELLKNQDISVTILMKSASENPKMVSMILNGMLDQSFRDRSVRKTEGLRLVQEVLTNWDNFKPWWASSTASENKMSVLILLSKVLQIDSSVSFKTSHNAFGSVFNTYTSLITDTALPLNLKSQALIILPFFTNLPESILLDLQTALEKLVACHFPMQSDEFPTGTLRYNNYVDSIKKLLDALEMSHSPMLLKLMTEILCRDNRHIMEELFQTCFRNIAKRGARSKQVSLLDTVFQMFQTEDPCANTTRQAVVDRCLLTILLNCSLEALTEFLCKTVAYIMTILQARFLKSNESAFDTQLAKKNGCYKIMEVVYSRLPKEEVYSKESKVNQAYCGHNKSEGNELSKTLLKCCFDAFTENMAGEKQLLEERRRHHCYAYNCAVAVISCSFNEVKFFQGFLFSEKPEKNQFILENLIDMQRIYNFPIEIEVPLEKKKKYLAIRKEAREADEPHYLSSQSYMADSSLSEEMSQFDFSTGIQSFSIGSQASTSAVVRSKRKVERAESTAQGDAVELEMDELNAHECMATLTALISHMQKNNITPKIEEGTAPADLPVWMKFLNVKLGNPSTPLNIRLFIAKLIINSEEVFRPYARHWLGPLLQLVVSDKNGGEGIHYMVVEIVVVLLSWTSVASPKGNIKDEVLANRLLEFLMKNAFHKKRAVYRHNLEIIKTVVECWKDSLEIPYRLIYECFSGKDPNSKNNSFGLQLLGIVLANNLPPFHAMCGIESERYFQALATNISFGRFQEVYAAAAEVVGLVMQYLADKEKQLEGPIFHFTVKELKQLQDKQEGTFVVCLNKITKNFPKLADSFMNQVFYLIPKMHGVLKTQCLEILMSRADETPDFYMHLKTKNFSQIMSHRDEARQQVCLDIIHKILAKLKPDELKELLEPIIAFIQHPSPVCREKMYDILMWIYDNYRDEESQKDPISSEVFCLSKENLLQGLMDENQPLQLYVKNFWSHETRLPINTLERMLVIFRSMYSSKIESEYLSLATNLLLEMTSRSPDYTRDIFEYPLSECKFQDYTIHSNWRDRSTILTPMFVETQATQGGIRDRSQDGSMSSEGTIGGQVRATQAQLEFTPTQTAGRRSSYNWLTGASIDTFIDYSLPTSSESLSSSLLVFGKRGEKIQKAERKPVGVDFGSKRLGLPGDEVDSGTKVKDQRADILRLRRRFLRDQEKVSHIYAQKNIREQKQEKANVAEQKLKKEGQVILYRRYRQGDLPDIQIQYSSLIAPLQALAQRDPTFAKQLFSSLFTGILLEMKNSKGSKEKKSILEELLEDINTFLSKSTMYFPPFVSCVQDMSYRHQELLQVTPTNVSSSCLVSLQQPIGILLLEESLIHQSVPEEPPLKRAKGRVALPPDTERWIHLAKLYRSLGDYDVLRGIFSGKIGAKSVTSKALQAEAKSDYAEAAKLYNEALNMENWTDGEPTDAEKDLWELAALEAYNQLTEWKSLQYCSTVNIDDKTPSDLEKIWLDPFYQETYLPYVMRSMVKLLQLGEPDQSLLTFVDNAMKADNRKSIIETHYSQELSLLYILQDDFDRAKYYINNCMQIFMQNYSSIDGLLHGSRLAKLQSVQTITEIQDFLNFMITDVSKTSVKHLIRVWAGRYPDDRMDPMNIWDDIITNRCFFLDKISEKLRNLGADNSMEVDEEGSIDVQMELDEPVEGLESVIKSCKFNMKLKMADSARKQKNFSVATKLLKELHREAKTQKDWLIRWVHSFSRFNHCRCQNQRSSDQILFVFKTIPLLEENQNDPIKTSYRISRDHNMLLGTSYSIIADVIAKDPSCLAELGEEKLQRLCHLSGASPGDTEQATVGLHRRALQLLQGAVKKVDEELQSLSEEYIDTRGAIEAYMTLANFCDRRLREEEESAQIPRLSEIISFPTIVVEKMLKALKLNSEEARLKFPRLLQLIELYPAETLDLMAKEVSSVPCWQLIGWLSQMMALLDKKEAVAVHQVITEIAESYPQALIYPFMISSENYDFEDSAVGHRNKEFVARLKSKLDKGRVYEDFINALQQLTNPDMLFKDWMEEVKNELEKPKKDKQILRKLYEDMWSTLGDPRAEGIGAFRRKFAEKFGKEFNSTFGKSGSKIPEMRHGDFYKTASKLQQLMKEFGKEPGNLKEYSPWMSDFRPEVLGNDLEIPGQYDGKSKPLPEYHAKIAGFDERVKVMSSIRRPKRLIIQGNDEREYPFLVKGGEDLRQDQRIEQLFGVMNIILSRDAACSQRNLQLKTYHVIPMTTRIGLIEWLENTCTLKEFLLNRMSENEARKPFEMYDAWLSKVASKEQGPRRYEVMYKKANRMETITSFHRLEHLVSGDLLRKAFIQMSMTPEAFLSLRSHFASSHALMCISHWILGIGDRHLSNFMINMETGGMVGIDFGHAFGSATQFLPVPELMPFRLTRQLLNLMLPMGVSGLLYSIMVHSLRAYRADPDLLLNTMDVFVKEPSLDWKNFELKQLKKAGTWTLTVDTKNINWYPLQKVNFARRKLEGANPAAITGDELKLGFEKNPAFQSILAVTQGAQEFNIRAREAAHGLSVETQVECLIDQATDPNLLGRVWQGWEPWV